MTTLQVVICSIVLAFSLLNAYGQAVPNSGNGTADLNEAALQQVLAEATRQVNDFYKTEGFPIFAPPPDLSRFHFKIDQDYQQNIGEFGMS